MPDADDRRWKARLFRRVASIPTEGGHVADRAVEVLAEQLECEAAEPQTRKAAIPLPHRQRRRFGTEAAGERGRNAKVKDEASAVARQSRY
jgi:hypothetical protein